jgi:hypothetical protein
VGLININITTSTAIVFQDGEVGDLQAQIKEFPLSAVIIDDLPVLSAMSS